MVVYLVTGKNLDNFRLKNTHTVWSSFTDYEGRQTCLTISRRDETFV